MHLLENHNTVTESTRELNEMIRQQELDNDANGNLIEIQELKHQKEALEKEIALLKSSDYNNGLLNDERNKYIHKLEEINHTAKSWKKKAEDLQKQLDENNKTTNPVEQKKGVVHPTSKHPAKKETPAPKKQDDFIIY